MDGVNYYFYSLLKRNFNF